MGQSLDNLANTAQRHDQVDEKIHELQKGDILFIPANSKKRFINNYDETLEFVALEEPAFKIEDAEPQENVVITPVQ